MRSLKFTEENDIFSAMKNKIVNKRLSNMPINIIVINKKNIHKRRRCWNDSIPVL